MDFTKFKMRYSANKGDDMQNYLLIGVGILILIIFGVLVFNILKKREKYQIHTPYVPTSCLDAENKKRNIGSRFYIGMNDDINSINSYIAKNRCIIRVNYD